MKITLYIVCMLTSMFVAVLIFYFGLVSKLGDALTQLSERPIERMELMDSPIHFKPAASEIQHTIVHDRKNALFQRCLWRS